MFADIKGSTALIEARDPEEATLILEPVLRCMIDAVYRFDGLVSKVLGDGLMALFGAPIAFEDHAPRACYAALAMRQAVREKAAELRNTYGIELQIRIGLNSGEVVVQSVGSDLQVEYDAIGSTVHLAARMEQTAPPDRIRLTSDTAAMVGDGLALASLGPIPVAGFASPVSVFELIGDSDREVRADASPPFPLVGRTGELEIFRDVARRVFSGRGQAVTITGEPGIGKSRICYDLLRQLRSEGWLCLSVQAAPHEAEPWLPIRRMLRSFFGTIADADAAQRVRDRIAVRDATLSAAFPALFELMGVDVREPSWRS